MNSYYDEALRTARGYGDDAVRSIRKLLGYTDDVAPPPAGAWDQLPDGFSSTKGKPGGGVRAAVEANDAANARTAAQARGIGLVPERAADAVNDTFSARDAAGPILAAGGAVAGAGLVGSVAQKMKEPAPAGITSTAGTAELANESRPVPVVQPDEGAEKAFTEKFKRQYTDRENKRQAKGAGTYPKPATPAAGPREQAQALIAKLNKMRMDAGGEVPEAPQMMAQINQLLAQANQQVNARTPQQAQSVANQNPSDPHAQAAALIAQLNEMRRQAGREVPQAPQIMAEVRRLQALGDQQRNAKTTARR